MPFRFRWGCFVLWALCVACDGPDARIVLGPMPPRPLAPSEEDGGPSLPEGATACNDAADCDDGVDCTDDVCLVEGYCRSTGSAARCTDGVFCNGLELCDPLRGCRPNTPPSCDDQNTCTIDACDEDAKDCTHAPRDFDRDGEVDVHCPGGTDCDDFDETRGARSTEVCGDTEDNDCDDEVDERVCGQSAHDRCDDALDVTDGGAFTVALAGAAPDYAVTCEPNAARDVVFVFDLDGARDVRLQAVGTLIDGSEELAAIALQRACGESGEELGCRRGFPADLRVRALPKGRHYVVASSFGAVSLTLQVEFGMPTQAPKNTSCEAALDVGDGGRFAGSFVGTTDRAVASCGIVGQPDLFYAVTLAATSDLDVSAISTEGAPLTFSVSTGCGSQAQELRCETRIPASGRLHQLPAGRYVIRLEGPSSRDSDFALDVRVLPPTPPPEGTSCSQPLQVELGERRRITLSGNPDSIRTTCATLAADALIAVELKRAMDLSVRLDGGDGFVALARHGACGDATSEAFCRAGAPLETRLRDLPAGVLHLVVSSRAAASATLELESLPRSQPTLAADNGTCTKAAEVPESGGLFVGDTSGLGDDYQALCGSGARSEDAVFRLVLTRPSRVTAAVDAAFDSVLHRIEDDRTGKAACAERTSSACDDDGGEGAQGRLDEELDAGTHYYVVDGFGKGNAGPFSFDVQVTAL